MNISSPLPRPYGQNLPSQNKSKNAPERQGRSTTRLLLANTKDTVSFSSNRSDYGIEREETMTSATVKTGLFGLITGLAAKKSAEWLKKPMSTKKAAIIGGIGALATAIKKFPKALESRPNPAAEGMEYRL